MSTQPISGKSHPRTLPSLKGAEVLSIARRGPEVATAGTIPRQPSLGAREEVRGAVQRLLSEGFNFRECMVFFRGLLITSALAQSGQSMKRACARLGLSRQMLCRHRSKSREIAL